MKTISEIDEIVVSSENLSLQLRWSRLDKTEANVERFVKKHSEYFIEPDADLVGWQKYTSARDQIMGIYKLLEGSECGFSDWFAASFELLQGLPKQEMSEATEKRLEELHKICDENREHYIAWCKWTNVAS